MPKAATTSARSASSRRCGAPIEAARPTRSCGKRGRSPQRGVKELLLISQDTTFYGIDRQERGALARLLRELNAIDGLEWIRLLYLYPTTIDDETLAAMAECEKVCKYIDLPLQHASNPVLKRMKRPGTRQKYDALLNRIRARVPGVALRTTFIVGFPGETEEDVDELAASSPITASTMSASSRIPTRKAPRRSRWMTTCRPGEGGAAARVMGLQKRLVADPQSRAGSASGPACSSTAPPATMSSS